MVKMTQSEMMRLFNDDTRPKFNDDLFKRSDEEIIEEVKKVILSCERDKIFTLKVISFNVVDGYSDIIDTLYKHEESRNRRLKELKGEEFTNVIQNNIFSYYGDYDDITKVASVMNINELNILNTKYNLRITKPIHVHIVDEISEYTNYMEGKFYTLNILSFKAFNGSEILYSEYLKGELFNVLVATAPIRNIKKDNKYKFINLKESDVKLLVVKYFVSANGNSEVFDVIISIPRVVDKYYFRISGNIYSAMYQIVDGSTYNNSTSNSDKHNVTLKTMFMPIRVNRMQYKVGVKTTKDETLKIIFYMSRIFNKSLVAMKYILAKFGLYKSFEFMGISDIEITKEDMDNDIYYTFKINNELFINVPKMLFDADHVVQSLVYTLLKSIHKSATYEEVFAREFWLNALGAEFNNSTVEKGETVLDSLESIYDIKTKETLRLKESSKVSVYHVLLWLMRDFSNLKIKDNLDLSTKKIRCAEYIGSLYAMKMSKGIYRILEKPKNIRPETVRKAIYSDPMYLLGCICKCKLVNYRNMVNDQDAFIALKYTYKGISGLGEQSGSSVPIIYRSVHNSHLGRVDLDSSSATDPGLSGTLCPLVKLYDDSFSDYQEPDFWEDNFAELMKRYKALIGRKEVITFNKQVFGKESDEETVIDESINTYRTLVSPIRFVEDTAEIEHLEEEYIVDFSRMIAS